MKAVIIRRTGGPEVLECVDLPIPDPGEGQILVRAHAIGVGKPDYMIRSGAYPWMPPLPAVIGNEMAGRVAALGRNVSGFTVGQPVHVLNTPGGCYAQYVAAPVGALTPLPEVTDFEPMVSTLNYLVSWAILQDGARGTEVKTIYVNGAAGGVGTAIIQLARLAGIDVIAGVSSYEKCGFACQQGATHAVNYARGNVATRVLELTGGRGVDLILDQFVGSDFKDNFRMLARFGLIVMFNWLKGSPQMDMLDLFKSAIAKSPAVRMFTLHSYDTDLPRRRKLTEDVVRLLASGIVKPHIYKRLTLAQARQAHEILDAGEIMGKLILNPE